MVLQKRLYLILFLSLHVLVTCWSTYIKSAEYLTNTFKTYTIKKSKKLGNIKILYLQPNPDRSFIVHMKQKTLSARPLRGLAGPFKGGSFETQSPFI